MNKIEKLTPEQEAALPAFRQRYLDIACGGGRIDRAALQQALTDAYAVIGKPAPRLFIFDGPAACMLALKIFKTPEKGQLRDQLGGLLRGLLRDQLRDQLRGQLRGQLGDQLGGLLRDELRGQLWDQLGDQLGGQLCDQSIYNSNYLWGSQDLFWIAWARFAEQIGVKLEPGTATRLAIMENIGTQCEWWWPYDGIVFASERPVSVRWDDQRRLHCETGLAVTYADGYGLSAWHGQAVPVEWVTGKPPAAADALKWPNMDQRAAACEIVGWHNILDQLAAKTIDDSGDHFWGRLVEVDLPDSGKERFLDALCGTGRRFALPVPPKTKSVDEAQSVLHGGLPASILRSSEKRT